MTVENEDPLVWCLVHFEAMDRANACMHCAPVRYSPITFRLAHAVPEHPTAVIVLDHVGLYEEDRGR
jgi:hypothetical protein